MLLWRHLPVFEAEIPVVLVAIHFLFERNLIRLLFRPKSVPNSPSIPRAFSSLRNQITTAWGAGSSAKKKQQEPHSRLTGDDKKKWTSAQDCSKKTGRGMGPSIETLYVVVELEMKSLLREPKTSHQSFH